MSRVGFIPKDRMALVARAEFGIEVGELCTAMDVLRFFEKPSRYLSLHAAFEEDECRQGELQDEARYS